MEIITSTGKYIHVLPISVLYEKYTTSSGRIRAMCPVHGGDHQKSLSVDRDTGWGRCFNATCQATVLIEELNPDVAKRLLQRAQRTAVTKRQPAPPPSPPAPSRPSSSSWQREECAALLQQHDLLCRALFDYQVADSWQAQAYLESRCIPLPIAHQEGLGYLPPELLASHVAGQSSLFRWKERLLFPLTCPSGRGFAGRSLWRWQLHMDENTHKALLDMFGSPPRWLKTNPAGWFCAPPVEWSDRIILVEGPFDRLALLAAGFAAHEVVALVGTAFQPEWLPEQVRHVVLALDGDAGGMEAMWRLVDQLVDYEVSLSPPPDDQQGKDWSERWRRSGIDGLATVIEMFDLIP